VRISKSNENNIKKGRIWWWFGEHAKNICLEWYLSFHPLNFYISFDGGENDYTLCFWFIWTFYIKFDRFFKWYPKEWNSYANKYLRSAKRKIGISQYGGHISLYLWHDGENDYVKEKSSKIWYKWIDLERIFFGGWCYHTLEESITKESIKLPEKTYPVDVQYRFWHKKWNRFYMKIFNNKGKSILINSNIKYPSRRYTKDDEIRLVTKKDLEREMSDRGEWYSLKPKQSLQIALDMYKNKIIQLRSCEIDWVPDEYLKIYQRKHKLKRINE
jgi:hypothetical protein